MVEPHQFKSLPKRRRSKSLIIIGPCLAVIAFGALILMWQRSHNSPHTDSKAKSNATPAESVAEASKKLPGPLKKFTGEQFKELYRSVTYPNTQQFREPPPITGNLAADNRIRGMAEARGYKLTSIPVQAIAKINEPRLDDDDLLQPLAAEAWQNIKEAARKAGYPLTLISAYRSPEYQRNLFAQRLYAHDVDADQIAAGQADEAVQDTLNLTAVPGYSRHHTGYTVDMWCEDNTGSFLNSSCYRWISANNYEHAKEYGWIPSYPADTKEQGPEPEPWEYVWVGRDRLSE